MVVVLRNEVICVEVELAVNGRISQNPFDSRIIGARTYDVSRPHIIDNKTRNSGVLASA